MVLRLLQLELEGLDGLVARPGGLRPRSARGVDGGRLRYREHLGRHVYVDVDGAKRNALRIAVLGVPGAAVVNAKAMAATATGHEPGQ